MFNFNPGMMPNPPRDFNPRREATDALVNLLHEVLPDEDKPVIETLRNCNRISRLCEKVLDYVKDTLHEDDKSIPREHASRANAVLMPIIESLEQFIEENV